MPRLDRDVHLAPAEVAVDGVARDAPLEQVERFHRHVEHLAGGILAHLRDQLVLARGVTKDRLATAASGGAPGHAAAFQHRDLVAALGEMQCGRATRDAGTDDAHVGRYVALERRPGRRRIGGRRVIGTNVLHGRLAQLVVRYQS